jgi:thiol-disulfide isomerase/thioredoxin
MRSQTTCSRDFLFSVFHFQLVTWNVLRARATLLVLLIAQSAFSNSQTEANSQTESQPRLAPAFTLKNLTGRSARLSDYKGKVVLINLWATWCAPCQAEMPELVKWQKEYKARGLQILGVTYPDEPRTGVKRIVRKFKLNYPVIFGTQEFLDAYQIGEIMPVTVVVDRDGNIRERILGILEPEEFKEKVAPLLNQEAQK